MNLIPRTMENKRLIDVSMNELIAAIVPAVVDELLKRQDPSTQRLYGMTGIMEAFHCSSCKAYSIRNLIKDVCRPEPNKHRFSFDKNEAIRIYLSRTR